MNVSNEVSGALGLPFVAAVCRSVLSFLLENTKCLSTGSLDAQVDVLAQVPYKRARS